MKNLRIKRYDQQPAPPPNETYSQRAYRQIQKTFKLQLDSKQVKSPEAKPLQTLLVSPRSTQCSYLIKSSSSTPLSRSQKRVLSNDYQFADSTRSTDKVFHSIKSFPQDDYTCQNIVFKQKDKKTKKKLFKNLYQFKTQKPLNEIRRLSTRFVQKIRTNLQSHQSFEVSQESSYLEQFEYCSSKQYLKLYLNDILVKSLKGHQIVIQQIIDVINKFGSYTTLLVSAKNLKQISMLRRETNIQNFDIENFQYRNDYIIQLQSMGKIQYSNRLAYEEFNSLLCLSKYDIDMDMDFTLTRYEMIMMPNKIKQEKLLFLNYLFPVLTQLEEKSKNELLSVDFSENDKIMLQDSSKHVLGCCKHKLDVYNIKEKQLKSFNAYLVGKKYKQLLEGRYTNLCRFEDIEHDYIKQSDNTQQKLPPKLQRQGTRVQLSSRNLFFRRANSNSRLAKSQFQSPTNSEKDSSIALSSSGNHEYNVVDEIVEGENKDIVNQQFKYYLQHFKYQIKMGKFLIYDQMLKEKRPGWQIAQMLIQHNMVEELQDYTENNLNFNLNEKTQNGVPLVIIAAQVGNEHMMRYLIEKRVDLNVVDQNGKTAYQYAMELQNYKVADLINLALSY